MTDGRDSQRSIHSVTWQQEEAVALPGISAATSLISPDSAEIIAHEDGENSCVGGSNVHPDVAPGATLHPPGDVEAEELDVVRLYPRDEPPVNVDAIIEKWEAEARGRELARSTKRGYRRDFEKFAVAIDLPTKNRRWLQTNGRKAIVDWVVAQIPKCRGAAYSALQSIWTFGLPEVDWPVNKKRDFRPRVFAAPGVRPCPEDSDIEPIFRGAEHEDDPYAKSLVLVALNHGGRPGNQLGQLEWADIREFEGVLAIVAESKPDRRFKSDAPVVCRLPPVASDALRAWRAKAVYNAPNDPIWPRRQHGKVVRKGALDSRGKPIPFRPDDHTIRKEWNDFLARHGISTWVQVANIRHWVEARGEDDRVPQILLAFMRGHTVKKATEGGLGYSSNRRVEKVLADQAAKWPEGPCGIFTAGEVKVVDELAPYMALVAEYQKGEMTTADFANKMEALRLRLSKPIQDLVP